MDLYNFFSSVKDFVFQFGHSRSVKKNYQLGPFDPFS